MARYTLLVLVVLTVSSFKASSSEVIKEVEDTGEEADDEEKPLTPNDPIPYFKSQPENHSVRVGQSVQLPCDVDLVGLRNHYTLTWKRGNGDILRTGNSKSIKDDRISFDQSNTLFIKKIELKDEGNYICQISTTPEQLELTHKIEFVRPPTAKPIPVNGLIGAKRGEPVTLACNVTGNPPPVVTWTRKDGRKFPDGNKTMTGQAVTFNATPGVYEFTATNSEGSATGSIKFFILTELELDMMITKDYYKTELTCTVYGEPTENPPEVWWSKNDQRIDAANSRFVQSRNGLQYLLTIDDVQLDDLANYTCTANNSFSTDQKTVEMAGVADMATLKRNALNNNVELEWSTVSHTPLTVYRLRYRDLKTDDWEELLINATQQDSINYNQTYLLEGLVAGTVYKLTIESENKFGWSKPLVVEFCTLSDVLENGSASREAVSAVLILATALLLY